MSTLESFFWHVLGYMTMPFIFIVGFVGVAAAALLILSLSVDKDS
ncbi:MAG: TIGR02808 family protein [Gammaproteobacteria bacterium]|nr:TIGR02808 family protein [Gammaproteobacteria bacterium]